MVDKRPPSDLFIVDAHTHMGKFRNFHIPKCEASGMIAAMDRYGIDISIVTHHASISSDFSFGNQAVAQAISEYPDRLWGYCTINPNYPNEIWNQLTTCFAQSGFRGIKAHPELHNNYPLDGPHYRTAWEFAQERALPFLSHTYFGGDRFEIFAKLAEQYPAVTILLGHAGFDLGIDGSIQLALAHRNVVLDLTGMQGWQGIIERLASELPAEQIIFGSDMPFNNAALQLGSLLYARIERTTLEKIAGLNAARLFDAGA